MSETFKEWVRINTTYLEEQTYNIKFAQTAWNHQQKKIDELKAKLKDAEDVVDFYADEADLFEDYNDKEDRSMVFVGNVGVEVLGKRARQQQTRRK